MSAHGETNATDPQDTRWQNLIDEFDHIRGSHFRDIVNNASPRRDNSLGFIYYMVNRIIDVSKSHFSIDDEDCEYIVYRTVYNIIRYIVSNKAEVVRSYDSLFSFVSYISILNIAEFRKRQAEAGDPPARPTERMKEEDTPQRGTLLSAPAAALRDLADALPLDYEQRVAALAEMNHKFHQEVAALLAPSLNAKLQATPHETYEQKKELAKWANEELRRFDLAIKCPKTGEPSILLVMPGHQPEIGRFVIEHKTPEGKRVRSVTTVDLPQLELMEANPRREAIKEWRERLGREHRGPERG